MALPTPAFPLAVIGAPGEINTTFDNSKTYSNITPTDLTIPGHALNTHAVEIRAIQQALAFNFRRESFLLNGDFGFCQRWDPAGDTVYTAINNTTAPIQTAGRGVAADRWLVLTEQAGIGYKRGDALGETGLTGNNYGVFYKITADGKIVIYQPIKYQNTKHFRGRTATFQVKMKSDVSRTVRMGVFYMNASGTADTIPTPFTNTLNSANSTDPTINTAANIVALTPTSLAGAVISATPGNSAGNCALSTSWQTFAITVTIPSGPNAVKNIIPIIWSDADIAVSGTNGGIWVAEAGFYDGAFLREWFPRLHEQEIPLIEHYCEKSYGLDIPPGTIGATADAGVCEFQALGTANDWRVLPFKVRKRNSSAGVHLLNSAVADTFNTWRSAIAATNHAISAENLGEHQVGIFFSPALTAGAIMRGHFLIDNEM